MEKHYCTATVLLGGMKNKWAILKQYSPLFYMVGLHRLELWTKGL